MVVAVALVGCSTGTVSPDDAEAITAPTFAPVPRSPADSPQLDALVLRDTAGLLPEGQPPNPAHVGEALAAVEAEFPGTDRISDLYFDAGGVWLTIVDQESPSRSRSIYWREDGGLSVGDAEFFEHDTTFAVDAVHLDAITALVEGLAVRYPSLLVDLPRLSSSLSDELGLSWRMTLVDGRGNLATIFADLDGTVTVVDAS